MLKTLATLFALFLSVHYAYLLMSDRNVELTQNLQLLEQKFGPIEEQMQQVKSLSSKLHRLTTETTNAHFENPNLEDTLAPVTGFSLAGLKEIEAQNIQSLVLLENADTLVDEMRTQIFSLSKLVNYFENQKELRVILPSICPVNGKLSSPFGTRLDPYTGDPTFHAGVDFAAPEGTHVVAPAYGRVVFVGNDGGLGNLLVIDHGLGFQTQYAHLKESLVSIGAIVQRGQKIAHVGNTGRSTGPHLHYEIRKFGIPVSPTQFMIN